MSQAQTSEADAAYSDFNATLLLGEELMLRGVAKALGKDPDALTPEEKKELLDKLPPSTRYMFELRTPPEPRRPAAPSQRATVRERPPVPSNLKRVLRYSGVSLAVWVTFLLTLLFVGRALSQRVTRYLEDARSLEIPPVLRGGYAFVVGVTSWSLLTTLPILFVYPTFLWTFCLVSLMRLFGVNDMPVVVDLAFVGLILFSVWLSVKMIRSLFFFGVVPGYSLTLERHQAPRVRQLFDTVARRLGRGEIRDVVVTPDAEFAYFNYGSFWSAIRGKDEAVVQLGAGLLTDLPLQHLECMVAWNHEYFYSHDRLLGHVALRVDHLSKRMTNTLIQSGHGRFTNPLIHVCFFYSSVLYNVTYAARRYHGLRAVGKVAEVYGAAALRQAQVAFSDQVGIFSVQLQKELEAAGAEQRGLQNLFTLPPLSQEELEDIRAETLAHFDRDLEAWEAPPSLKQALDFAEAQVTKESTKDIDDQAGWAFFPSAEKLQTELTHVFAYSWGLEATP